MPDSLAEDLGEVPAKDVATYAKAATDQAAKWIKRIGVEAGPVVSVPIVIADVPD